MAVFDTLTFDWRAGGGWGSQNPILGRTPEVSKTSHIMSDIGKPTVGAVLEFHTIEGPKMP